MAGERLNGNAQRGNGPAQAAGTTPDLFTLRECSSPARAYRLCG